MRFRRRVALIFGKQGPWVNTQDIRKPRLEINGLREEQVRIYCREITYDVEGNAILAILPLHKEYAFDSDGTYPLPMAQWMRVEFLGNCQGPICVIKGEAA